MNTESVAVPADYYDVLLTRLRLYRNANAIMRPAYRAALQNTLMQCSLVLRRPVEPPEGWSFAVAPDGASIYPGIQEGSPITLLYPAAD